MCLDQATGFRARPTGGPRLWQAPATQQRSVRPGDFKGEIHPAAPNTKLSCCYTGAGARRGRERLESLGLKSYQIGLQRLRGPEAGRSMHGYEVKEGTGGGLPLRVEGRKEPWGGLPALVPHAFL